MIGFIATSIIIAINYNSTESALIEFVIGSPFYCDCLE
jgi:hypothetical protein